jgi:hypothetical protein
MKPRRFAIASLAALLLSPGAAAPPRVGAQGQDPCTAALASSAPTASSLRRTGRREEKYGPFGADDRNVRDLLQRASMAAQRRARTAATTSAIRPLADRDESHIAILEDHDGDLIIPANRFDLANSGLRFEPAGAGYAVSAAAGEFRNRLGNRITLADDDSSAPQTAAFPFELYGVRVASMFVNSDGNLTFGEADNASTARGLARLAAGAPRIAPFFADLDPSVRGGIFIDNAADAMTITWCGVPGFDRDETVTVQAVLFSNHAFEFRFGATTLPDAVVAVSPGQAETVFALDLHPEGGRVPDAVPIGELFQATPELDLVAASRRFYQAHPDNFDQLVFWTDVPVLSDAFAFETTVKNAITGTGLDTVDGAALLGSGGSLESVINMDRISKYPDAPAATLFGEHSTLGVLAHETGHRWLTRLMFRDADRAISDALLGRQRAHWSFFVDSDGSVMEGNEITDLGGGSFRTGSATEKYSRLDMYAMGLATPAEVPRWFYVDAPIASVDRESPPTAGIGFTGTRRDVLIQDVVDALGPRVPAAADSTRVHRQAFVFVRRPNALQDPRAMTRLNRIREEFPAFFSRATENRMTVRTTLTP